MSAVSNRLRSIRDQGGMKYREVAQLLDTTPETVSRWNQGHTEPQPDRLDKLLTLEWLLDQLAELYEPEEARLWLFSPHRLLDGRKPAELIKVGRLQEVLAVIAQLKEGAFA